MHILVAFGTFILFLALDYVLSRRQAVQVQPARVPAPEPLLAPEPVWVAGYQLPEGLHYHRGHTWARVLSPDVVAVGMDDFSKRLLGRAEEVKLPSVGTWVSQGAAGTRVTALNRIADLLSPVEGEVVAVNTDLKRDPTLATRDPYGHGWLFKVRPARLASNLKNLLSGRIARRWTEDAREQLDMRLMALSGSVLQDGGEPAPDFAEHLELEDWQGLVETFLLTEGRAA